MMNYKKSSFKGYLFVFIISISLFIINSKAYAELKATIVDLSGSKTVLTKLTTTDITLKIGETVQVIPLKSIIKIFSKGKDDTFTVSLASGKEIIGNSNSTIQGTWELGEYKINLSKVKSIIIEGASQIADWKKPNGIVAEVVDTKGSKTEIYGFAFGYTYSYTRSNCMWNCGSSSNTVLEALPLNQGKGALIIPLNKIASISDIYTSGKYSSEYNASITLTNGKVIKSRFGSFGGENIQSIKGKTEIGEYSLSLNKTKKIVFQHEKNLPPLPKYEWGKTEGSLNASVACQSGFKTSMKNIWKYHPNSDGTVGKYSASKKLKIKIGEAQNDIDFNKVSDITINTEQEGKYSIIYSVVLTTKSGNKINAILEDNDYIGGYTNESWFFYVKFKDLKQLSIK